MISLKEYSAVKREAQKNLQEINSKIKELFDGKSFDREIYSSFGTEEKSYFSALLNLRSNLEGQLDTFQLLEGFEEGTMYLRIKSRLPRGGSHEKI